MTDAPDDKVKAALRSAPDVLDDIKEDLGITGTADDAWLARQLAGVWSAIESHTGRRLCNPPASFVDDWGEVIDLSKYHARPPLIAFTSRASVFLRVVPVVSITACNVNGQAIAPAAVVFDKPSGKLFALDVNGAVDLGDVLLSGRARVTYSAGFAELPGDLYQVLLGSMTPLWAARQAQASGIGGGGITGVNVMDVGSIELGNPNSFITSASRPGGISNPLLGPFVDLLAPYVDWRSMTGAATMPTTKPGP